MKITVRFHAGLLSLALIIPSLSRPTLAAETILARAGEEAMPAGIAPLSVVALSHDIGGTASLTLDFHLALSGAPIITQSPMSVAPSLANGQVIAAPEAQRVAAPVVFQGLQAGVSVLQESVSTQKPAALEKIFTGARRRADPAVLSEEPAASDQPSQLGEDAIVYRGWQLARCSKSQRARFGALVVDRNGRIIGEGWNRQSTKIERRLLGVGIIIHAEQVAVAQALRKVGGSLEGARVYAVGISKDAALYAKKIQPAFACKICARTLERFRVAVMSSSARGFHEIPWDKVKEVAEHNQGRKWWQASYKGKAPDPNIRWLPITSVEERLRKAAPAASGDPVPGSVIYELPNIAGGFQAQLQAFRDFAGQRISDGVAFRKTGVRTPQVLTFRIKRFFFEKILSGEKHFEFREVGRQNNALISAAIARGARFVRLHFQDNDIQLLAEISRIDVVTGKEAAEPWDKEQGTEPGDAAQWRVSLRNPTLLWDNSKSRALAGQLGLARR
jgi:hypothetical protein